MSSALKISLLLLVLIGSSVSVLPVQAQVDPNVDNLANKFQIASGNDLQGSIQNVVNWLLGMLGLLAVIVIVYGGVQYILSAGDDKKAENGKRTVLFAMIGLILVGISAVIVNSILSIIR